MSVYQGVFQRREFKYLINEQQYRKVFKQIEQHMQVDQYGCYTIGNLYFDTPDFSLIRQSIEKPVYEEKLRIRSYGIQTGDSSVFVELKKKYRDTVYKRRISMTMQEAEDFCRGGTMSDESQQIGREIAWFMNLYHPQPRVYIAYDRVAFFCPEDSGLRITFDHNIRWRTNDIDFVHGTYGKALMDKDTYLMEIKAGSMPLWLVHMLSDMEIYKTSFSKYGTCYSEHLAKTFPLSALPYHRVDSQPAKEAKTYA